MIRFFTTILILLIFTAKSSFAASLEELIQSDLASKKTFIRDEAAEDAIPSYSRTGAEIKGEEIASKAEAALKAEADQKIASSKKDTAGEGIVATTMERQPLDGFEEHEMFTEADKIWSDPVAAMNEFDDCKTRINNAENQYTKRTIKETKFDEIIEERICEKPAGNVVCEKTLSVGCEGEEVCSFDKGDDGLFTSKSNRELMEVSGGLRLRYYDTILELGNEKEYTYDVGKHGCVMKEFTAKFYIGKLDRVSHFTLTEVFENNLLHVEINGHVVYNGLGGHDLWISSSHTISAGGNKNGDCGINAGHTSWKAAHFDILKNGFLKEGENHMKIKLAVHWLGHAGVRIDARKKCCSRLIDKWEKRCWLE